MKEELNIIELDNPFMVLYSDHDNIDELIGKKVIYEKRIDDIDIITLIGTLKEYREETLLIDDEHISLNDIRGIEEYKEYGDVSAKLKGLENHIIKITNHRGNSIEVLYLDHDEDEIRFIAKINDNGNIKYNELFYYIDLITDIEIVK